MRLNKRGFPVRLVLSIALGLTPLLICTCLPHGDGKFIRDWIYEALWGRSDREVREARVERPMPDLIRAFGAIQLAPAHPTSLERQEPWPPPQEDLPDDEVDVGGDLLAAVEALTEMGDAGKVAVPAWEALVKSREMHYGVYLDFVWSLRDMGPKAKAALPLLRRQTNWLTAAMAIYAIEGTTNALVETLARNLAEETGFKAVDTREIWCYRDEEQVTSAIAPQFCQVLTNTSRPLAERVVVASYLGALITTNDLVRTGLKSVLSQDHEPELRKVAEEALENLEKNKAGGKGSL
jgi:hypothetical protein